MSVDLSKLPTCPECGGELVADELGARCLGCAADYDVRYMVKVEFEVPPGYRPRSMFVATVEP